MTRGVLRSLAAPVLAVALLVTSGWLLWDWTSRRQADAAGRDAMAAARDSIAAMGSFRPDTAEQSLTAARDRLTGDFLETFTQTIRTVVIPDAARRKMTSVVTVPAIGVVSAQPDRVELLAYVDQSLTVGAADQSLTVGAADQSLTVGADADAEPVVTPSRYRVRMDNVDGRWLVAGFDQI